LKTQECQRNLSAIYIGRNQNSINNIVWRYDPCACLQLFRPPLMRINSLDIPKSEASKRLPTPYAANAAQLARLPRVKRSAPRSECHVCRGAFSYKDLGNVHSLLIQPTSFDKTACPNRLLNIYSRCNLTRYLDVFRIPRIN
jgi:hypothetical protein